ncbi:hypothetical protein OAQ25_05890 [Candidatus Pelagibacter sp.]|nr:hypothetical protein [Candidatus Pelagibacter sp.]
MKTKIPFLNLILYVLFVELFVTSSFAYAYLDPGMISAFASMLIAGVIGALITIKFWWYRFKNYLSQIFKSKKDSTDSKND